MSERKNNPIYFTTEGGNKYFYDRAAQQMVFCHEVLAWLVEKTAKGEDAHQWMKQLDLTKQTIELPELGAVPRQTLDYYYQKFCLLEQNGYFTPIDNSQRLSGRIRPEDVARCLANIPQVTFEVTDKCNLHCAYCAYGKFYANYDKRTNHDLDPANAKNLLDYLSKLWDSPLNRSAHRNVFISFYGGEPLLNMPFIKAIVDYVNNLKHLHTRLNFIFNMTTNGLLLDTHMDYLKQHNFELLISLDGDEENNGYRIYKNGKPGFKKIFANIKCLQETYPDYFERQISFNAVIHNKNSISQVHRFFKEQFQKIPSIGELNLNGIDPAHEEEFRQAYTNIDHSLQQAEQKKIVEKDMFVQLPSLQAMSLFTHRYSGSMYTNYNDFLLDEAAHVRRPTATCYPFEKKIFMTTNGKLLNCERIGQADTLGWVDAEAVHIDNKEVAEIFNRTFDKVQEQCDSCCDSESCEMCIFTISYDRDGNRCRLWRGPESFARHMAHFMTYMEKNRYIYKRLMKRVIVH
jgi:uncharacterized protein